MSEEYIVNIGSLKVSGTAEDIHKLAIIYDIAACDYGSQIVDEIHGKHRDKLIAELQGEQRELEDINKQLIDTIRDSKYFKKHLSESEKLINSILEEL